MAKVLCDVFVLFYCVLLSQCRVDAALALWEIGDDFCGFRRGICVADFGGKCRVIVSTGRNATVPEINTVSLPRGRRKPHCLVGPPEPQEIGGFGGVNLLTIRGRGESVEMTQPLTGAGATDCGGVAC